MQRAVADSVRLFSVFGYAEDRRRAGVLVREAVANIPAAQRAAVFKFVRQFIDQHEKFLEDARTNLTVGLLLSRGALTDDRSVATMSTPTAIITAHINASRHALAEAVFSLLLGLGAWARETAASSHGIIKMAPAPLVGRVTKIEVDDDLATATAAAKSLAANIQLALSPPPRRSAKRYWPRVDSALRKFDRIATRLARLDGYRALEADVDRVRRCLPVAQLRADIVERRIARTRLADIATRLDRHHGERLHAILNGVDGKGGVWPRYGGKGQGTIAQRAGITGLKLLLLTEQKGAAPSGIGPALLAVGARHGPAALAQTVDLFEQALIASFGSNEPDYVLGVGVGSKQNRDVVWAALRLRRLAPKLSILV